MKKKAFWKIALAVVAVISFTACTNDESSPLEGIEEALPESKYPLEIASVTMEAESSSQPWGAKEVQTRVSETADRQSSVWDGEEKISVQITNDTETAIYTLETDKVTLTSDKPLYWKNKNASTVRAWYPADGNVDLSNQTKDNGLAYALFAKTENAVDYSTSNITLPFVHKLAKVCVVLQGSDKDKVEDVKIKTFTSCTLNADGTLINGGTEAYIPMVQTTYNNETCWEANVVPNHPITQFQVNGNDGKLNDNGITPEAAKVSKITLTVGAKEITGGQTITEPGDYFVTGNVTETITLNGEGINLTLKDANISVSNGNAIAITSGSPTIHVEGTNNTVKSSDGAGIYVAEGSTVNITGDSRSDQLTVTGGDNSSGIGAYNQVCGNIAISNVTVSARGTFPGSGIYSAGIGGSGSYACGTITIDNATVYAYGMTDINWNGNQVTPGIGGGLAGVTKGAYGAIKINNSTVYTHRGSDKCDYIGYAGATGFSASSLDGIDCNGGGITGSTVYCYTQTSKDASTLDKTIVYDADGTGTVQ